MASVVAVSSMISRSNPLGISIPSSSSSSSLSVICLRSRNDVAPNRCHCLTARVKKLPGVVTRIYAAVEEETLIPASEETPVASEQSVSVPVSPSDSLTMFFQAEGTMEEENVPKVIDELEKIEGVADLQVRVGDGIASIELTKQTTVQATGVASNLVEVIQGSGFKLQTLNLSFKDEEDATD